MDKPTTLLIEEFKQNISNTVTESGLPVFILEYLIKDLYNELHNLSTQMAQQEKTEYLLTKEQEEETPALS